MNQDTTLYIIIACTVAAYLFLIGLIYACIYNDMPKKKLYFKHMWSPISPFYKYISDKGMFTLNVAERVFCIVTLTILYLPITLVWLPFYIIVSIFKPSTSDNSDTTAQPVVEDTTHNETTIDVNSDDNTTVNDTAVTTEVYTVEDETTTNANSVYTVEESTNTDEMVINDYRVPTTTDEEKSTEELLNAFENQLRSEGVIVVDETVSVDDENTDSNVEQSVQVETTSQKEEDVSVSVEEVSAPVDVAVSKPKKKRPYNKKKKVETDSVNVDAELNAPNTVDNEEVTPVSETTIDTESKEEVVVKPKRKYTKRKKSVEVSEDVDTDTNLTLTVNE